jgi:hypothetical protein
MDSAMASGMSKRREQNLALAIEPDLRTLKGLVTVLRYLGERPPSDIIEPAAIAALVIPAEEAIDRLIELRRES